MKKFMLIFNIENEQSAKFFDNPIEALDAKLDYKCGSDGCAQLYVFSDGEYIFIYE